MFFIVVGCGRVGAELAFRLYQQEHEVAVIDFLGSSFSHLDPRYRGRTVAAEVLSADVLQKAGIDQADGLAAVTNSDTVNAVVGHLARTVYHIPNVVVRNYDPRFLPLHQAFGLHVVGSTAWGAQRIEEMLYHPEGRTVFSAGNGEVEVYEVAVPEAWGGRGIQTILKSTACLPVAVTRAGKALLPATDIRLETGDLVLVSATLEGIETLRRRLAEAEER